MVSFGDLVNDYLPATNDVRLVPSSVSRPRKLLESNISNPRKANSETRTAIVVLGMHRSGTSALSRVISLLGAQLPRHLMAATVGNEIGHWESQVVADFNDSLFAEAGSRWNDWLAMPAWWSRSTEYQINLDRARDVLQLEFGQAPLFVLKDPRICRLAPFWLAAIESLDIRAVVVLVLRHPLEVSASLGARDASQAGFGLLLWLRHVLEAEAASRGQARCFVSYDQLLADWNLVIDKVEHVAGFSFQAESQAEAIEQFLSADARHQCETASYAYSGSMPAWVRDTYAIMLRWCEAEEDRADYSRLDEIRAAFDVAAPSFALLTQQGLGSGDGIGSAITLRREIEIAQASHADVNAALVQARVESADLSGQVDRLKSALESASAEASAGQKLAEQARAESADLSGQVDRLKSALESASAEASAGQKLAEQARAESADLSGQIDLLKSALESASVEASAEQKLAEQAQAEQARLEKLLQDRVSELESALHQRREEAAQAWAEVEYYRTVSAEARSELAHFAESTKRLTERLETSEIRISVSDHERVAAQVRSERFEYAIESMARRLDDADAVIDRQEDELRYERLRSTS